MIAVLPFRESECTPAGRRKPGAFICAAFEFTSDIWIIDRAGDRQ